MPWVVITQNVTIGVQVKYTKNETLGIERFDRKPNLEKCRIVCCSACDPAELFKQTTEIFTHSKNSIILKITVCLLHQAILSDNAARI